MSLWGIDTLCIVGAGGENAACSLYVDVEITMRFAPLVDNLQILSQGKVRDVYSIGENRLLVVASDRISTHNQVHESIIPGKGIILTALSVFWFKEMRCANIRTHLIASGRDIYEYLPEGVYPDDLHLRAMVVRKLKMLPIEFVFRLFMAGSLWREYCAGNDPYGLNLPPGLELMSEFDCPVLTPTCKSEDDEPCEARVVKLRNAEAFVSMRFAVIWADRVLRNRGIRLIDTKLEAGLVGGQYFIGDEVFTLDNSRFCLASECGTPGTMPPSFDKEVVRSLAMRRFEGRAPHPVTFSPREIESIRYHYHDVFKRIVGVSLEEFKSEFLS